MTKKNNQVLMLLSAVGLMAFTACTNDKYDLGDIDMTIGVGSDDGLTLPTSSTKEILLDDLLELDNSDNVVIKENGDYVFLQAGDSVDAVHPMVDNIVIAEKDSLNFSIDIDLPDLPADLPEGQIIPNTAGSINNGTGGNRLYTFEYAGTKPDAIETLKYIDTKGSFRVYLDFSDDLKKFIPQFKTFELEFPSFMEIEAPKDHGTVEGNILKVNSVTTNKALDFIVNFKRLDFKDDMWTVNRDSIVIKGDVKINAEWDDMVLGSKQLNRLGIDSKITIEEFSIIGATGSYNPKFTMDDLGSVNIGDLPDFLTNENVKLDLFNPQIVVNIESDMAVPGFLTGTLTATKKDGTEIVVDIPKMKINDVEENGGISNIMICRQEMDFTGYTDHQVVPELAKIIEALPYLNTISFGAVAGAESSDEDSKIELGREYTIKPSYTIEAPIAFGNSARIVYTDSLDGWNDDIQDYEFANEAYIEVTADIENCIPAYLTMSATAIDINGKESDGLTAEVMGTIAASMDGQTPVTTPITITIKQKEPGALRSVDGLTFTIEAAAADENGNNPIEGITLNAKNHHLTAKNIKVTVKGKVIIKNDD